MIGNKKILEIGNWKLEINKGFTLIELIVAMAVFATVITVVSSIFVSSVGSQRKNVNQQEVLENARYVLETISRSIRQSTVVTSDSTSSSLSLSHPTKGAVAYTLNNGQILENGTALSSGGITVERLSFIIQGNSATDNIQPRVTISISLKDNQAQAGTASAINLQTTVTPRNLQIQ